MSVGKIVSMPNQFGDQIVSATNKPAVAERCPCGDSEHSRWLVAGTWTCEPYPCQCAGRPSWAESCWYRHKITHKMISRCYCSTRERHKELPHDCCAWEVRNPRHLDEASPLSPPSSPLSVGGSPRYPNAVVGGQEQLTAGGMDLIDELAPRPVEDLWTLDPSDPEDVEATALYVEPGEFVADHPVSAPTNTSTSGRKRRASATQSVETVTLPALVRRYSHAECHCGCATPWDGQKVSSGYHCPNCHSNWTNLGTAEHHRRRMSGVCRLPGDVVDVDTGRRLLAARSVGGFEVWGPVAYA